MRRRRLLQVVAAGLLVLVGAAAFALWPRPSRVTRENFSRISTGMTLPEIEAILGGPPGDYRTVPTTAPRGWHGREGIHVSGEFCIAVTHVWHGDSGEIEVDFDPSGKVCTASFETRIRDDRGPLGWLLWRAERLWRRWFP